MPKSSNYEDFDPIEVARQICIYEQNIYRYVGALCANGSYLAYFLQANSP